MKQGGQSPCFILCADQGPEARGQFRNLESGDTNGDGIDDLVVQANSELVDGVDRAR